MKRSSIKCRHNPLKKSSNWESGLIKEKKYYAPHQVFQVGSCKESWKFANKLKHQLSDTVVYWGYFSNRMFYPTVFMTHCFDPLQVCSSSMSLTTGRRCLCCAQMRSWSRPWKTTRCSCRISCHPSISPISWRRCHHGCSSCLWLIRSSPAGLRCSGHGPTWRASSSAQRTSAHSSQRLYSHEHPEWWIFILYMYYYRYNIHINIQYMCYRYSIHHSHAFRP